MKVPRTAPELFYALKGYTRRQALSDVTAGVIVGIVALPLAIAFAIASGLPPEYGLYTAVIAGFLISACGGSRVQIGGPTGAFVVIVYGIVQQHGVAGLTVATIMAGAMLIVMGVIRLGAAIKFIPFPVTTGFTSGIAVVIASSQVRDLLGLRMPEGVPAEVALAALALKFWPRISRTVPAAIVAIVLTSVAVPLLQLNVETIGSRFGELNIGIPRASLPTLSLPLLQQMVGPAFTIALLAAVESLLSAVVADGMIGARHRSNVELVGQGIANIVTPIFGGMPATGAIARTATNVRNGGRTPVAGMVHAITLALLVVVFGRWAAFIPLATLAAILIVVAYHMSEWRVFTDELRGPRSDIAVLLTTFVLTVVVDLTVALEAGMVLAAFLFMKRMSEVTNINAVSDEFTDDESGDRFEARPVLPKGVQVYEINGPFFFGAAEKFKDTVDTIADKPRVLILRMRNVPAIDSTGLNALRGLVRRSRHDGTRVFIAEIHAQPMVALGRSYLLDEVGEENLFGSLSEALAAAQ
jgi:SulP family sulfate permease